MENQSGEPGGSSGADPSGSDQPDATFDPSEDDDEPIEAWKLILGVVGVFVVITVIGLVAFAVFGGDDTDTAGTGPAAPSGTDAPAGSITDDFDRANADNGLGKTPTGQTWETVSGTWGIRDQQAALIEPNAEGNRSLTVLDLGAASGTIQATGSQMTNGWGLVFRYRSQFNYWYLVASSDYASYNLIKVTRPADSDEVTTTNVAQINLANARTSPSVKIVLRASLIEVWLDGKLRWQGSDNALANDTKVGLIAVGEAPIDARWDEFVATPDNSVAITPEPGPATTPTGNGDTPSASTAPTAPPGTEPESDGSENTVVVPAPAASTPEDAG